MIAFDIYKKYVSIKLHFNSGTYDYVKFKGSCSATINSYNRRGDKYFFEKLSTVLQSKDIVPFFVAQFVSCNTTWIGEMLDDFNGSLSIYRKWKGSRKSLKENIRTDVNNIVTFISERNLAMLDIFKVENGITHPIVLRFYLEEMISIETMMYLDNVYDFIPKLKEALDDPVSEHHFLIIEKYKSFLNIKKDILN